MDPSVGRLRIELLRDDTVNLALPNDDDDVDGAEDDEAADAADDDFTALLLTGL